MARFDFAFFQLLFRIISRQTGDISRVDYFPQKKHCERMPEEMPFPRATPESQGISSALIEEYFTALKDNPAIHPHHAMIARHGRVIAECHFAPYEKDVWHITHSMCKSVTGMAIGLLVDSGKLSVSEKLSDIFPEYMRPLTVLRLRSLTVKDLLDMTSHAAFNEAGAISGNEWRKGYLEAGVRDMPGMSFEYNSMNSYMLSAIVTKKTGQSMYDYLVPRLFRPLGIADVMWETCPQGITKGGWGMFLRPEDALKLGQLYLQKGRWNGQQIISEDWVRQSTQKQVDNGEGNFGYGYQIWMEERPGGFAYNGMLGQDVVVYPDLDMVLEINAGNDEMTQSGSMTDLMRKTFGIGFAPEDFLPEDPCHFRMLQNTIARLEGRGTFAASIEKGGWDRRLRRMARSSCALSAEELTEQIAGNEYELDEKTVGLFPLLMQVFHNNFTDGIQRIGFVKENRKLYAVFYEGEEVHCLAVGFGRAEMNEVTIHKEPYLAAVCGMVSRDETGRPVLMLNLDFPEEACSRQVRFYFRGDELEARWQETPGEDVMLEGLHFVDESPTGLMKTHIVHNFLEDGGRELLDGNVKSAVKPVVYGKRVR